MSKNITEENTYHYGDLEQLTSYVLKVIVKDKAGNTSEKEIGLTTDRVPVYNFEYTGKVQIWEVPVTGTYKLEVWGAEGGTGMWGTSKLIGGLGGYSFGKITLNKGTKVYVYVGGEGESAKDLVTPTKGGFNGGGTSGAYVNDNGGAGGGATDIRLVYDSLYSRVIVAGGGGGGASGSGLNNREGGYGGGAIGGGTVVVNGESASGGRQDKPGVNSRRLTCM